MAIMIITYNQTTSTKQLRTAASPPFVYATFEDVVRQFSQIFTPTYMHQSSILGGTDDLWHQTQKSMWALDLKDAPALPSRYLN
jgi:hypothetical protein